MDEIDSFNDEVLGSGQGSQPHTTRGYEQNYLRRAVQSSSLNQNSEQSTVDLLMRPISGTSAVRESTLSANSTTLSQAYSPVDESFVQRPRLRPTSKTRCAPCVSLSRSGTSSGSAKENHHPENPISEPQRRLRWTTHPTSPNRSRLRKSRLATAGMPLLYFSRASRASDFSTEL